MRPHVQAGVFLLMLLQGSVWLTFLHVSLIEGQATLALVDFSLDVEAHGSTVSKSRRTPPFNRLTLGSS